MVKSLIFISELQKQAGGITVATSICYMIYVHLQQGGSNFSILPCVFYMVQKTFIIL